MLIEALHAQTTSVFTVTALIVNSHWFRASACISYIRAIHDVDSTLTALA